jgi:hypothetical protein
VISAQHQLGSGFRYKQGFRPKNDPLDTRMIASFVAVMPTRPAQLRPPAIERLADHERHVESNRFCGAARH